MFAEKSTSPLTASVDDQDDWHAPGVTEMYTCVGCPTVCTVRWLAPGFEVIFPPFTAAHHPFG